MPVISRDRPAAQLSDRLPAEARSAGPKDQDRIRALRQLVIGGASLLDVRGLAEDAEMGEAFVLGLFFEVL